MPPSGDDNPYAPPESEVGLQSPSIHQKMPRVVKWAWVVAVFWVIGWLFTAGLTISKHGMSGLVTDWIDALWCGVDFMSRFGLILALIFARTYSLAYRGASVLLLTSTLQSALVFLRFAVFRDDDFQVAEAVFGGLIYYGLFRLFHAFTFGQPSRLYYGISQPVKGGESPSR